MSSRPGALTREQRFLLEACLRPDERAVEAWQRWRASVDLDHLDGASQRLVPLLYRNLHALGVRHPILRRYKGVWRYNWCKNQQWLARVSHLARVLEERSLPFVVLKDLALVLAHEQDLGVASISAVGLLVRSNHVSHVLDVLAGAGYRPLRRRRDRIALEAEGDSPPIDLRWRVFPSHLDSEADAPFWSRAQIAPNEWVAAGVLVMDRTDLLLHVLGNGVAFDRVVPIRWLPSAAVTLRRPGIVWPRFVADAERFGLARELAPALRELRRFVDFELPAGILDRLDRGRASLGVPFRRFLARDWWPKTVGALSLRTVRKLVQRSPPEKTEALQ